jgi:hypothetical protein
MKELSTSGKLYVLRHGPSFFALSPNKSLLLAFSGTLFTTFFRSTRLPAAPCYLLRFVAQFRCTYTPALHSIQFA